MALLHNHLTWEASLALGINLAYIHCKEKQVAAQLLGKNGQTVKKVADAQGIKFIECTNRSAPNVIPCAPGVVAMFDSLLHAERDDVPHLTEIAASALLGVSREEATKMVDAARHIVCPHCNTMTVDHAAWRRQQGRQ